MPTDVGEHDRHLVLRQPLDKLAQLIPLRTHGRQSNHDLSRATRTTRVPPAPADGRRAHPRVHGANNHRVYADYVVPAANELFARNISTPASFSYRTVLPHFAVWGYDVSVDRPNDEFLSLGEARADGRSFVLTGTGRVVLQTPAAFAPGSRHQVTATAQDGGVVEQTVTAGPGGQLEITIDLGGDQQVDQTTLTDVLAIGAVHSTRVQIA
ncbi:hypothetical protein [Pseudonocardia acidicola]|uniref:Uncharacterized protein n=1 Tax=Pseudonocardia acidicola TaxID=2724939 RepID=A0ABX1SF75_9PSEU|nr:hypothetical protein [Pseudonocardia acidicola]NMI00196.1 hypothetical protein [Pseudonocardia acidicola]